MSSVTGRCNCKAVSAELKDGLPDSLMLCHCQNCHASSGSLFSSIFFQPRDRVVIAGLDHIQMYRDHNTDSGNVLRRHFCKNCGSHVYCVIEGKEEQVIIHAGVFEPKTLPPPGVELFGRRCEVWEKPFAATVFEGMPPAPALA